MRGLDGKTAVVTGGAQGIGRAIATELAAYGASIAIIDLQACADVVDEIRRAGGSCMDIKADVRETSSVQAAADAIHAALGNPALLVNNVGGVKTARAKSALLEMSDELWNAVIDLNLTAAVRTIRQFCPAMVLHGGGAVVNVTSTAAHFVWPETAHYTAAKAALVGLTRAAAFELGPAGVRVNAVSPASVATPGWAGEGDSAFAAAEAAATALNRVATPEDIARVVAFLLSDEAGYLTGAEILCDGGYSLTGQDLSPWVEAASLHRATTENR